MSDSVIIRAFEAGDLAFLWDILWEAAAVDEGMQEIGKETALAMPIVAKYLEGWGRDGDGAVIAVSPSGRKLGAAWYRVFTADAAGYGYAGPNIPELSIGVEEDARGRGVGSALLDALIALARAEGYQWMSLSVDRRNPAVALYTRKGFRDAGISPATDTSFTMIIDL